jgi:hypothetical protein
MAGAIVLEEPTYDNFLDLRKVDKDRRAIEKKKIIS